VNTPQLPAVTYPNIITGNMQKRIPTAVGPKPPGSGLWFKDRFLAGGPKPKRPSTHSDPEDREGPGPKG